MHAHRLEVAVVVQQCMTMLDAIRADDQVRHLADCDPNAAQHPVIASYLNSERFIEHSCHLERAQVPGEARGVPLIVGTPQHLHQYDVPHQERPATELLQAILGIQPDAPRGRLLVDPVLPRWLPDITLSDLRLGRRRFDIRFWREGEATKFEVLRGDRELVQRRDTAEVFEMLRTGRTRPPKH